MANFGPKPWVNPSAKILILRLFELVVFIKMAFFCSEAWVNPFGKMRFMGLAKIFVIIVKKISFFFKKSLSIFSSLILTKSK